MKPKQRTNYINSAFHIQRYQKGIFYKDWIEIQDKDTCENSSWV